MTRHATTMICLIFVPALVAGCKSNPPANNAPVIATNPSPTATPLSANEVDLLKAADAGDTAKVKQLLDESTNVNVKDATGRTPLIEASYYGHADTVKLLLEKGANPNAMKNDGTTAMGFALSGKHNDVAELL